jgi:hypothetical protein
MKTAIIAIIFLLVGGSVGGFLALGLGTAAGIVVGAQAGTCLAVETAKEQGLLSVEQIDQVLTGTIGKIKSKSQPQSDPAFEWAASEADCAPIVAEMEKAAKSQE